LCGKLSTASKSKKDQVLRLVFLTCALEEDLDLLLRSYDSVNPTSLCEDRLWPVFRLLEMLRPTKRLRGELVDYARESQQGWFEWTRPLFRREACQWRRPEVLHFGLEPSKASRMAATVDVSRYDQTILSVISPVSRSPLLRLDKLWRRVWNWCRAHPWIVTGGVLLLLFSIMMFIATKIRHGIAGLAIDLLLVLFGPKVDDLRDLTRQKLNSESIFSS